VPWPWRPVTLPAVVPDGSMLPPGLPGSDGLESEPATWRFAQVRPTRRRAARARRSAARPPPTRRWRCPVGSLVLPWRPQPLRLGHRGLGPAGLPEARSQATRRPRNLRARRGRRPEPWCFEALQGWPSELALDAAWRWVEPVPGAGWREPPPEQPPGEGCRGRRPGPVRCAGLLERWLELPIGGVPLEQPSALVRCGLLQEQWRSPQERWREPVPGAAWRCR